MVDIPVHHDDPLEAKLLPQVLGSDRHAVEQAKAHSAVALGVMPWRPYQGKAIVYVTGHNRFEQGQQATGSKERSGVGLG